MNPPNQQSETTDAVAPEKIYLQFDGSCEHGNPKPLEQRGEVTWCADKIWDRDVLYIRSDIHEAELTAANAKIGSLETMILQDGEREKGLNEIIRNSHKANEALKQSCDDWRKLAELAIKEIRGWCNSECGGADSKAIEQFAQLTQRKD